MLQAAQLWIICVSLPYYSNADFILLKHLTIKNYALIERLETEFYPGFSVMTGETGAGKSIILGALGLILGQRADLQSLMNKQEKCIVEGVFATGARDLRSFFERNSLDYDNETAILRREILPSGKSRAFINDTPANLSILKELAEQLIDIHSQNSITSLLHAGFQLLALDSYAGLGGEVAMFGKQFGLLTSKKKELNKLLDEEATAAREQDFYRFQVEELEVARLVEGEQESLEEEIKLLSHAEEIKQRLTAAGVTLNNERGLLDMLNGLLQEIKPVKSYYADISAVHGIIENCYLELKEAARDIEDVNEKLDVDPQRLSELNQRLDLINALQQKHRVGSIGQLLAVKADFEARLTRHTTMGEQIEALKGVIAELDAGLKSTAKTLSVNRKAAGESFAQHIMKLVAELGMPNGRFSVDVLPLEKCSPSGSDDVVFRFNANRGGSLQEMARVASGGELSRLLLAIKATIASRKMLPAIIFDEIDSGVSGEIAGKMGAIMQMMSQNMQVLAITHLPQIAARGNHHYVVYKKPGDEHTRTYIRKLDEQERISEIAKMLSDTRVTDSAMETARELLKN
jgi:DNA repair protein RecN (Recombination protein N)